MDNVRCTDCHYLGRRCKFDKVNRCEAMKGAYVPIDILDKPMKCNLYSSAKHKHR